MLPNVERGYSFKGVTAYLTHDARENPNDPHPPTSERVDFFKLRNFIGDEARTPEEAAKIMALIVRDADKIKRAAGTAATGRKATAPPVYHFSLSWHPTEQPSQAKMERAAEAFLKSEGLDERYLSYFVAHNDTDHRHLHGVVCLVDPVTGKQANPHFDKQKAQLWGAQYEREQGKIFCHNREARLGAIERARPSHATKTRAAFNDNSRGAAKPEATPAPDRFGRSRERTREPRQPHQPRKGQSRLEWQARQDKSRAAQEAADRIKADTAAKWAALKASERVAFAQRGAEFSRLMADRNAGRDAIYQKYQAALDGIWKPEGGPKSASPDRRKAWLSIHSQQEARKQEFEANERTALGRVRNALTLAGKDKSLWRTARLAINAAERRSLFERGQWEIVARILPREQQAKERPRLKTPEPKRVQAERVKAMRARELAEYARETKMQAAAMKARHDFQKRAEKDARTLLSKEIGAAWEQHRATYGKQAGATKDRTRQGQSQEAERRREAQPAQADRFGRSRDRQRQPREDRGGESGKINREAEKTPVQGQENSAGGNSPGNEQATTAPPEAAQQAEKTLTPEEAERNAAIDREQAAQEARREEWRAWQEERAQMYEQGRDMGGGGRTRTR